MPLEYAFTDKQELLPGTLYIVSTPIGNLRDITIRALEVLSSVDFIAAEDTRHSRILLNHYGISQKMISFHDHNKVKQAPGLLKQLSRGTTAAVITDAGTPGISDPGFYLVREAIRRGIKVEAVPGVTATIAALVVSGLPTDRFTFEGFAPAKKGRRRFFENLKHEPRTIILYESPYRVKKTLHDIFTFIGDRQLAVVRELTKKFEEILRCSAAEAMREYETRKPKGEFVILIHGYTKKMAVEAHSNEN